MKAASQNRGHSIMAIMPLFQSGDGSSILPDRTKPVFRGEFDCALLNCKAISCGVLAARNENLL